MITISDKTPSIGDMTHDGWQFIRNYLEFVLCAIFGPSSELESAVFSNQLPLSFKYGRSSELNVVHLEVGSKLRSWMEERIPIFYHKLDYQQVRSHSWCNSECSIHQST